ncbi:ABC transporter permease [Gramella sp. KN1008]|uniref:ABC transporter permease n=1 Tax=Gramella sp. KN1008 TaxID=2529298 RepID=UPI00103A32B7|nr:ABC transporter permease [Gramella sp. KN1008]TBW25898.1 FtsX-like permease family protein [Gramella sp. KN1008]
MIRNYFKIAWRSLIKEKTFAGINIVGLSVAFASAVLLGMYSIYELSYDNFHQSDRIYQSYSTYEVPSGRQILVSQPIPFAEALKQEVPGIEQIARYNAGSEVIISEGKQFRFSVAFTDPHFFKIFDFPVSRGDSEALGKPNEIALTQETAQTIFGKEEAVGKTISMQLDGEEKPFLVTSVLKNIPQNSSLGFDIAADFTQQSSSAYRDLKDDWGHANHEVYIKLEPGVSVANFEKASRAFSNSHNQGFIEQMKKEGVSPDENGQFIQERLLPLKDIHLAKEKDGMLMADRLFPNLLLGIAILIIFIASVNFINMSIARNFQRIREIGMRKTLGAGKGQLFFQFWGESLLVFLFSALLGLGIARLLLKEFQSLFRTSASLDMIITPQGVLFLLLIVLLVSLIAGGYPAFSASRIETISALKGRLSRDGNNQLRDTLIVFQFAIAILLISGTVVLYSQLEYLQNKDLGFNKQEVISIPMNGKKEDARVIQQLRNELGKTPGIESITAANGVLGLGLDGGRSSSAMSFQFEGRTVETNLLMVEYDYPETIGLELVAGRSFDRSRPADSLAVIINENMAQQLNQEKIIGTPLQMDDTGAEKFTVIGVVKDYNFQDLDQAIEPISLFLKPHWNMRYIYVKVRNANSAAILKTIEKAWKKIEPEAEFQGSYLNENIDRILKREKNMITMITSGSIVAITLSCMGLFAMSLIVAAQRKKEIGIRKVVGAGIGTVTMLLTRDFVKLVLVAFVIATPVAWYFSSEWLQNYPYRVSLSLWMFLAAGLIALIIAVFTISFKTIHAAVQNPVKSLKTE